ncbi:MAG: hypothetical protein NW224_04435 [Leptolyngbyaceae cyanobacterium bins.302]|nr:hypothetical protein [Leptolyngbyaceae cyanobacterium bins.302]
MGRFNQVARRFRAMAIAAGMTIAVSGEICGAIAQVAPTTATFQPTSPVLLAQRFECRQVVPSQGAPFYSSLPQQQRPPYDYLPRGARVSVDLTSPSIRAPDGRFYQFVTYPFNGRNTVTGYIPVQIQNQNGQPRNTLEACRRKIMW